MSLKAALNAALEQLGADLKLTPKELETVYRSVQPEPSQDTLDGAAHEYNVSAFIASYGEARKKKAKDRLYKALGEPGRALLDKTSAEVKANELSDTIELGVAQNHSVSAQVKIGATYLDVDGLKVDLMKKMKTIEVEALIERHTRRRDPSVTLVVGEHR